MCWRWAVGLPVGRCAGGGQSVCHSVLGGDLRRLHLAVITHTHTTCVLSLPQIPTLHQRGKAGLPLFNIRRRACNPAACQGGISACPVDFYLLALVVVNAFEVRWEIVANKVGVRAVCGAFLAVGLQLVEDLAYHWVGGMGFIHAVIEVEEDNMLFFGKGSAYACEASALVGFLGLVKC